MVVVVGDDHLAFVRCNPTRIGELARFAPLRAPLHRFSAFQVEALDAIVAAVSDVHVVAGHGYPSSRWLRVVLGGAELELSEFASAMAPRGDEVPAGVELLDPVVAGGH